MRPIRPIVVSPPLSAEKRNTCESFSAEEKGDPGFLADCSAAGDVFADPVVGLFADAAVFVLVPQDARDDEGDDEDERRDGDLEGGHFHGFWGLLSVR